MPGRRLSANISSSGTRKNAAIHRTGGKYSAQNVARRERTANAIDSAPRGPARIARPVERSHGAALTSVHIAVQSSRCFAVRFGVKFVR
jgi:hypothetical protein